jgi:quercetin dioxygenase-like cupin family protein
MSDISSLQPTIADLENLVQFAERGIVSKTLFESPVLKLVLFCFEPGQALSEHTAPFEAVIHVLQGKADIKLGDKIYDAAPGALYVMPSGLNHAVTAKERFVFLLTMTRITRTAQIR